LSHLPLAWSKQTRSSPSQHGQGRSDCQNGLASTQEGKANTWGRAREEDPQEGPFNKDGSQKDRLTKPFDSAKNKPGSGDPDQITYPTEEIAKLKKKLQKSKRHSKKHARESTDNDSNDNLDTGSSSTGSLVDKRIKIEQSLGVQLKSTDIRPIKATKLALDTIRANEIAIIPKQVK